MTATLRQLSGEEAAQLVPEIERGYAEDIQRNGGLTEEQARRKASDDVPRVVADTANVLYALTEDGEDVGHLWLGEREVQGRRVLWIWDVFVNEEQRGRGLGRAAMQLVEEEARRRGIDRVELNVFGGNEVARGLYRSLDYDEVAVWMAKELR
jgi:GNAT superfamily N-acetyltransferase